MLEETVVLENSISELVKLQNAISNFGTKNGLSQAVVNDINLILEEAVVNIIYYAYTDKKERHKIFIRLKMEKGAIISRVEDDGIPFDPLCAPEPKVDTPIEEIKIGGHGIHLMRKLARSVSHHRDGNKNILTIEMGV